mgnify:CR=1 FL=1
MYLYRGSLRESLLATFSEFREAPQEGKAGLSFYDSMPTLLTLTLTGTYRERFQEIKNCREAFMHFAEEKGFDPLKPENWYTSLSALRRLPVTNLFLFCTCFSLCVLTISKKGAQEITYWHGGLKKALQLAFPDLSFGRWQVQEMFRTISAKT